MVIPERMASLRIYGKLKSLTWNLKSIQKKRSHVVTEIVNIGRTFMKCLCRKGDCSD
jgi:hypothetical protein